jgi:hypothetical protein
MRVVVEVEYREQCTACLSEKCVDVCDGSECCKLGKRELCT